MTLSLLAQQSPKTYGWLRRAVDQGCLTYVEEAYQCAIALGANDERHLNRTEGASYNPRPARLILLLGQEGNYRDRHSLVAAVFLPVASKFESCGSQQIPYLDEVKLACTALKLQDITALSGEVCGVAHDLYLTWLLDTLRHLHMQHRTADTLRAALDELEFSRGKLPQPRDSRLQVLVDAHIERLRRQL